MQTFPIYSIQHQRLKFSLKKKYVYHKYVCFADLSAEQLKLLIKTKSMAVNRRTDRQLLYLRQLASLSAPPENKIKLGSTLHAQYYRTTEIACRLPGNTWLLGSIETKLMLEKIHKLIINENYQFKYKRKLKLLMIIIYTDGKLQTHIS